MGADCIISGIRPQIAQTIVHLGVDLNSVTTKATLGGCVRRRPEAPRPDRHEAGRRAAAPPGDRRRWPGRGLTWSAFPILKMGEFLLVSIQVDMHDRLAMQLQDDLTERIAATSARGVLIDISVARDGRFVHRPHARQHRRDVARARCADGRRRHAALRSRSRSSSSACRCRASERRSTWSAGWTCCRAADRHVPGRER